jgi:hypothetical protein
MTKKQQKKINYLIVKRFRSLIIDATRLNFSARLKMCYIILFKKTKLIQQKGN